jgi:hypothetical protein
MKRVLMLFVILLFATIASAKVVDVYGNWTLMWGTCTPYECGSHLVRLSTADDGTFYGIYTASDGEPCVIADGVVTERRQISFVLACTVAEKPHVKFSGIILSDGSITGDYEMDGGTSGVFTMEKQ